MKSQTSSRDVTNYLKGFAIIFIMVNTYINSYLTNAYSGYANGILALFFVISGYGIFNSLEKYDQLNSRSIIHFFLKRALRIYPLLWLSLILSELIRNGEYTWETYLALPFTLAPELYWFIIYLVQCYLVAPLFYLALKRWGVRKYITGVIILMILVCVAYPLTSLPFNRRLFVYRFLFLGHIFLFVLGMSLPLLIRNFQSRFSNLSLTILSTIVFIGSVYLTHDPDLLFKRSAIYFAPLFILSAIFFCLILIATKPVLPLKWVTTYLGTYWYSIYLFHLIFYKALVMLKLIKRGSLESAGITLMLYPLFVLCCSLLEGGINRLYAWLQPKIDRRILPPEFSEA